MNDTQKPADWAPKVLRKELRVGSSSHNPEIRDLLIRLTTSPEMEYVWKHFQKWVVQRYRIDSSVLPMDDDAAKERVTELMKDIRDMAYEELINFAILTISAGSKPATKSDENRRKALLKVAKNAKQLHRSLENLEMPDNILWYFPWLTVRDYLRTVTLDLYEFVTGKNSFGKAGGLESALDVYTKFAKRIPEHWIHSETYFSIYELLETLSDDDLMEGFLPSVFVQRAQEGNESRLFLIRACATHIHKEFQRDPMKERTFISNYVRVVLDDSDINEDTVKDALHGYDISLNRHSWK